MKFLGKVTAVLLTALASILLVSRLLRRYNQKRAGHGEHLRQQRTARSGAKRERAMNTTKG